MSLRTRLQASITALVGVIAECGLLAATARSLSDPGFRVRVVIVGEAEPRGPVAHRHVDFELGLNLLTGETGAGKSLIVEAVNSVQAHARQAGSQIVVRPLTPATIDVELYADDPTLPMAVEVTLWIQPTHRRTASTTAAGKPTRSSTASVTSARYSGITSSR